MKDPSLEITEIEMKAKKERRMLEKRDRRSKRMRKIAEGDPETTQVREARLLVESMVDAALMGMGKPPIFGVRERGRPPAPHPLPRRDPVSMADFRNTETHLKDHNYCFVIGCQKCYMREYLYFQNHPEKRPIGRSTAGADEVGRPCKSRPFRDGWDPVKYPFKA